MAVYLLFFKKKQGEEELDICDNLVYVGWAFLTIGMLFGALWAKEAWGTYWAWDPKETWAAATWLAYLVYIHYRLNRQSTAKVALWILLINFVLLQMCWWGINYLPSAQRSEEHTSELQSRQYLVCRLLLEKKTIYLILLLSCCSNYTT